MPLLVTLTIYTGCTKSYDPGILLSDRIALLTGQPDSVNWVLNDIQVNIVIDTSSKGALKVYHVDGTFTDNLGFAGYWTLYFRDSLVESTRYSVNPNAPYFTSSSLTSLGVLSNLTVTGAITGGTLGGTLLTANQPNITSVGTLNSLTVSGDPTVTGTVTAVSGLNSSASSTPNGIGYTLMVQRLRRSATNHRPLPLTPFQGRLRQLATGLTPVPVCLLR